MIEKCTRTALSGRWRGLAAPWPLLIGLAAVALMTIAVGRADAQAAQAGIVISEIFYNPDGADEGSEFVEITNTSAAAVDVSGWAFTTGVDLVISDDTLIGAGQTMVFARDAGAFQTAFGGPPSDDFAGSLSNGGETISLRSADAALVDEVTWSDLPPWPAGPDGDGESLQMYDLALDNGSAEAWGTGAPTPFEGNSVRLDVIAVNGRGWYDGDQTVELSATLPGAEIFFTTDSGAVDQAYNGPLTVDDNGTIRVLRIQARLGNLESPVVAHTYVFKPDQGVPTVATWPNPVPVAPGQNEATVSFEFIPPPSTGLAPVAGYAGMAASAGGVDAGQSDKLFFRGAYGNGTLAGDLFSDFFYGIEPATEHDQLFLRDEHLDGTHLRQIIAHDALLSLGQLSPHGRFVEYYKSGSDQGVRHLQERPEGGFMESYTDIDKDEWLAWSRHENGIGRSTMGAPYSNWAEVERIVNVDSLIDFSLVQWQANVEDYRSVKNLRVAGPIDHDQADGGDYRYHFFNWDMDIGYNSNWYGRGAPDLWAWADFVTPDYVMHSMDHFNQLGLRATDRIACAFFGDGPLTSAAFEPRLEARRDELVRAGGANAAAFTANLEDWIGERNTWLLGRFRRSQHTTNVYNTQRADRAPYKPPSPFEGPLLAELDPVDISFQNGRLSITNAQGGDVYYRLDGGDPRTGTGQVSADAIAYAGPVDLPPGRHEIRARTFDGGQADVRDRWSPSCTETIRVDLSGLAGSLVINELHYNPLPFGDPADPNHVDGDRFEFIEIHNPGAQPVAVGGFSFGEGIDYEFPLGAMIDGGAFVVLASDAMRFEQRFGTAPDGDYGGNLSDGGETIALIDSTGQVIDQVTYDDELPWDVEADSGGPSLSLISPDLGNDDPVSWRASSVDDGSPFAFNVTYARGDADGSLSIDSSDVQAILDHNIGLEPVPFVASAADYDGDGQVSLLDALMLAQALPG